MNTCISDLHNSFILENAILTEDVFIPHRCHLKTEGYIPVWIIFNAKIDEYDLF
jgi:hypothetical protein